MAALDLFFVGGGGWLFSLARGGVRVVLLAARGFDGVVHDKLGCSADNAGRPPSFCPATSCVSFLACNDSLCGRSARSDIRWLFCKNRKRCLHVPGRT